MAAKFNLIDKLSKEKAKNEKLKKQGQEMVKTAEKNLKGIRSIAKTASKTEGGIRSIAKTALRKNFPQGMPK